MDQPDLKGLPVYGGPQAVVVEERQVHKVHKDQLEEHKAVRENKAVREHKAARDHKAAREHKASREHKAVQEHKAAREHGGQLVVVRGHL
jgi:hypothetical protein